ncbi:DELLA protein GAI1-like [Salvia splendens]|uniref:DELLA protein GAI1-like n=1 Tax=Salvia splendens TaxID=180675 RepID=UPI001C257FCB|nr:DELLA protein GAI1-like [Salvia splendens]
MGGQRIGMQGMVVLGMAVVMMLAMAIAMEAGVEVLFMDTEEDMAPVVVVVVVGVEGTIPMGGSVLGYSVKPSDMADIAQKIEHLEQVMCSVENDGLSQLASDTTHYNPSDLSSWLESMISGLNPTPDFDSAVNRMVVDSDFGSDLTAIAGKTVYPSPRAKPPSPAKKLKLSPQETESSESIVMVDSHENRIRLVHSLMACAEVVQKEDFKLAEALVKNIGFLAVSQAGAMRKVATYFAEALARRIYRLYPANPDSAFTDLLQIHFYETCPCLKFAHFTVNQAILESFAGRDLVHVVDFSMKQGMQWPPLLQALAPRLGGPPIFRLTAVGPPSTDNTDQLKEIGWKLAGISQIGRSVRSSSFGASTERNFSDESMSTFRTAT